MRLLLPKNLLASHLQIVAKAMPTRSVNPALEGVLFECDGEKLTLTATNLELGIQTQFAAAHKERGQVVLPGKTVEIIRHLPGDSVLIEVNPENFTTQISSAPAEFQVYGYSADDYPNFPEQQPELAQCSFRIKVADLRRALRQTLFCVSHDEGKPAFIGVFFSLRQHELTLSASDTFRLATTTCAVESKSDLEFLVPGKNLNEVLRVFTEDEAMIEAAVMQNQLFLNCNNICISSRLIDENYPNITRVIPKSFTGKAIVETAAFTQAVERASLLAEGNNHVLRFLINKDTMVMRASSKYGKIQEVVPIEFNGEEVEIAFNARFMLEMLKITEGDQCLIELNGHEQPFIMRDSLYDNYLYLILPVKIS
ncbi:MAG TPA: DNA polymerase III subunit beta [Oscillospiraceae bacterium]|nr:DNA polymerase III subunit beta [Oscillospiraceae bacterium]